MAKYACILSCEHGGNAIPSTFQKYFEGCSEILASHRGWDPGTLILAQRLSKALDIPLVSCTISRLLIEMNRSLDNPELFSEFTKSLKLEDKTELINTIYKPYRDQIRRYIDDVLKAEKICLHFSIHSFTPVLYGIIRDVDIGILFDPDRQLESSISNSILNSFREDISDFKVLFNTPYKGTEDGLTTSLRLDYLDNSYAGIEIEINQKWIGTAKMEQISNSLLRILHGFIQ